MVEEQVFAAVKIDIVNSRTYKDREALQKKLLWLTNEESNRKFAGEIVAKFVVTHGDELQGLVTIGEGLMDIANFFMEELFPIKLRMGIGIGSLSTELQPQAIGMDGPAFHYAKEAIDYAHQERKMIVVRGTRPEELEAVNTILDLMTTVRREWTELQTRMIQLARDGLLQEQIAGTLAVTQSSVSKNLKKANWKVYAEAEMTLRRLFNRLRDEYTPS